MYQVPVFSENEIGAITTDINTFLVKFREIITSIQTTSTSVAISAEEMNETTLSFADNAQSQAASAEEVTATVEQISAGMDSIADGARNQYEAHNDVIREK